MTGPKVAQGGRYANAYHVLYCAEKPGPDTKAFCCIALLPFDCQEFVSHADAARQ